MPTLHESMLMTKTIEYILSAVFLVLFVLFWNFVFGTPRRPDPHAGRGDHHE